MAPSADTSMTWAAPTNDHHRFEKAQLAQWAREDEFDRLEADFVDYFIRCGVTGGKFNAMEFKSWLTLEELRAHFVEWSPNADRTKNYLKKVDRNRYVIRFQWC